MTPTDPLRQRYYTALESIAKMVIPYFVKDDGDKWVKLAHAQAIRQLAREALQEPTDE